jgi:hypothetical protein
MLRRAVAVAMAAIVGVGAFASYAQAEETRVKVEPGLDQTTFEIPVDVCGELCGEEVSEACPVYRPMEHAELPGAVEDVPCRYNLEVKNRKLGTVFSKEGHGQFGEAVMSWYKPGDYGDPCWLNGKTLTWTVELSSVVEPTWEKSERGSFKVEAGPSAGCDFVLPHLKSFNTSRDEARQAVVNRLYPMFVSHLVCKRAGKGFNCKTVYNDTTTQCRATFRAVRMGWVGGSEPNSYYVSVGVVTKRCHSF